MMPDMLHPPHSLTGFSLESGFSVGDARGSSGGGISKTKKSNQQWGLAKEEEGNECQCYQSKQPRGFIAIL
jgi:hypothetical protein